MKRTFIYLAFSIFVLTVFGQENSDNNLYILISKKNRDVGFELIFNDFSNNYNRAYSLYKTLESGDESVISFIHNSEVHETVLFPKHYLEKILFYNQDSLLKYTSKEFDLLELNHRNKVLIIEKSELKKDTLTLYQVNMIRDTCIYRRE